MRVAQNPVCRIICIVNDGCGPKMVEIGQVGPGDMTADTFLTPTGAFLVAFFIWKLKRLASNKRAKKIVIQHWPWGF